MAKSEEKSMDQLQREILEVELQTKTLGLAEAKKNNAAFLAGEQRRHKENTERQSNMAQERAMHLYNQKECEHMAGGEAGSSPLKGGGKFAFSTLARTLMPDGKTTFLQCPRCRLKLYGRDRSKAEERKMEAAANVAQKKFDDEQPLSLAEQKALTTWDNHLWWKELMKLSEKEGIPNNGMRGPTFVFTNSEGIPFIPEMR